MLFKGDFSAKSLSRYLNHEVSLQEVLTAFGSLSVIIFQTEVRNKLFAFQVPKGVF